MKQQIELEHGITVREMKELIKDWPEKDYYGKDTTVWMETGDGLSSTVKYLFLLNRRKHKGHEWADIEFSAGLYE